MAGLKNDTRFQRTGVLLLTQDVQTQAAVAAPLGDGGEFSLQTFERFDEFLACLKLTPSAISLVDIDPDPSGILQRVDHTLREFPDARFIALSSEMHNDWLLAAMKAGTRYFLAKKNISSGLGGVLDEVLARELKLHHGHVVTVLSAGGGCGTTTIAINLAQELRLATSKGVLLVDMDTCYGGASQYLGLTGPFGLADVLSHPGGVDRHLIKSTAVDGPEGLHMLLSPAVTTSTVSWDLQADRLDVILGVLKQVDPYVVIDAPRVSADAAAVLARHSRATLIVFQSNVKDVRVLKTMLTSLSERGIPRNLLLLTVSRVGSKRAYMDTADVKQAVGDLPMVEICNDYRAASEGLNSGQFLARRAHRSPLRKDIELLARRILAIQRSASGPASRADA